MSHPPGPREDDDRPPEQGASGPPTYGQGYPSPGYGTPYPQEYGQYPPSGQYGGYGHGPTTNGKATAALVTGISSLVLSWCCGLGVAGVVAIVLGVKARNEIRASRGAQTGDGMALAGIITGAVAIVLGLAALALVIFAIASGSADYNVDTSGTGGTSF